MAKKALAGFENDPKFNLGNYGYTLRRAKGKGASFAYKNEKADKAPRLLKLRNPVDDRL